MKEDIPDDVKNAFQWLMSEMWNCLILSTIGYHDQVEEKLISVVKFMRDHGITEESMALECDIDNVLLSNFFAQFKEQEDV